MRAAIAAIIIALVVSSPVATQANATNPNDILKLQLSSSQGDIGDKITIYGNITIYNSPNTDKIQVFFGNLTSSPVASVTKTLSPKGSPNATFIIPFYIPLVDSGKYTIYVNDSTGVYTRGFSVTFGVDTLIGDLKGVATNEGADSASLTSIISRLNTLASVSQLNSFNNTISSLKSLVTSSNNNIQSLYPLLILFVALEGLLVGLVVILTILFTRKRPPRTRPEDVEVLEA